MAAGPYPFALRLCNSKPLVKSKPSCYLAMAFFIELDNHEEDTKLDTSFIDDGRYLFVFIPLICRFAQLCLGRCHRQKVRSHDWVCTACVLLLACVGHG